MTDTPDIRDELVGAAVARLSLEPEADDFFDRLTDALDNEDAAALRTTWWGGHKRRSAVMSAAIGLACLALGGLVGAALAHRSTPQTATPRLQSAERIAYTVVGGRRIAAFHTSHAAETPSGTAAPGFGLTVPAGWDGRLLFPNTPGEMPDIQAGNFTLPPDQATDGSGAIQDQMGPSDVFIWIGDDGQPADWMLTYPGWQQTTMPITINPSDYRGTYEGQTVPLFLLRHVIVDNHALLVGVEFGTASPSTQTYTQVNQILSTLTLD